MPAIGPAEPDCMSERPDAVGVAQLVSAPDCGSGDRGFESHHSPSAVKSQYLLDGLSPRGKAQHFDCCIRWFESN